MISKNEYVLDIDFKQLKSQKKTLLSIIKKLEQSGIDNDDLVNCHGLLNMIDYIQDIAVDLHNLPESEIFDFVEDDK